MSALENQLKLSCALAQARLASLGLEGCMINFEQFKAFGLMRRGTIFEPQTPITKQLLRNFQLRENLFMFQRVVNPVDNTAENVTTEIENTGINKLTRSNPISISCNFENGYNFASKLPKFNSFDQWDMVLFDSKNTMWLTKPKGDVKGFTVGMFAATPYKGGDGATNARSGVTFQLIRPEEWNEYAFPIPSENLDFFYADLTDVNDVTIEIIPPLAGSTEISFKAVLTSDRNASTSFDSISKDDLKLKIGGSDVIITALSSFGDGYFTASFTDTLALNDVVTLESWNPITQKGVVQVGNILYRTSAIASAVVV